MIARQEGYLLWHVAYLGSIRSMPRYVLLSLLRVILENLSIVGCSPKANKQKIYWVICHLT